jgi:transglutaminase-like putative cysteine protease
MLQGVVLVGAGLGIVLAKSRSPRSLAHLLSALAGFAWAAYLTSTVVGTATGLTGQAAVLELQLRIETWFLDVISSEPSSGNYVFLLLLALLLWLMAYFSAWAIFRWQRVWWAVVVCGLALLFNITYAHANLTMYLLAFLLVALLLVVRANVAAYEQEWRRRSVVYGSELVGGFLRAGLVLSLMAILLAWVAPEALASRPFQEVLDKVGEPWRRIKDESSRIFPDLNYQNEPVVIALSRAMRFGGPVSLTDTPVMDVRAPMGRYWRYKVYHEYTGDGWNNTDTESILVEANEQGLTIPPLEARRSITQTITLRQDWSNLRSLVAASQPVRAKIPLQAVISYITQEEEAERDRQGEVFPPGPGDPSLIFATTVLKAGSDYKIVSSLSVADRDVLREAGTNYPSWVVPRYLQLPNTTPERVLLLADEITEGLETPYDKAIAVRDYLRDITYNEQVEAPSPGQDGVDYFLFDIREGYCSYYASAMTVMLRAVGVPARYVEGYSQHIRDEGVFNILELDGHSWTEVYFPRYGWVEFEPTGADPINDRAPRRPASDSATSADRDRPGAQMPLDEEMDEYLDPNLLNSGSGTGAWWQGASTWVYVGFGLLLAILAAGTVMAVRRRRRIEGLSSAERVYEDLVDWVSRLLRITPSEHQTPHEFAGAVAGTVPQGREPVQRIVDLYVAERFGGKVVAGHDAEDAWRETYRMLWRRWLDRRISTVRRVWEMLFPSPVELDVD